MLAEAHSIFFITPYRFVTIFMVSINARYTRLVFIKFVKQTEKKVSLYCCRNPHMLYLINFKSFEFCVWNIFSVSVLFFLASSLKHIIYDSFTPGVYIWQFGENLDESETN